MLSPALYCTEIQGKGEVVEKAIYFRQGFASH